MSNGSAIPNSLRLAILSLATQAPVIAGLIKWSESAQEHPGLTLMLIIIYEVGAFALTFGKKVWGELEPQLVRAVADWVKVFVITLISQFRRRYRQQIIRDHGIFNVRGLGLINTYTLALDQVFVDLRIHPSNPQNLNTDLIGKAETPSNRPIWHFLRLTELQSSGPTALAIIGPPGCGKTTLLQHVATTLAENRQHQYRTRSYIPILLFLRDHLNTLCGPETPTLDRLVQIHFENTKLFPTLEPPPNWFKAKLRAGKCIVLLDGLDEVAELEQRRIVSAWVDDQIKNYPRSRFVLTARPRGYVDAPLARAHVLEVQPFNAGQVQTFVRNWYLANEILSSGNRVDNAVRQRAERDANDLLERMTKLPSINALTVNPLLLTMIAMVHRYHGALPGSRVELYAEICEVLLGRWRQTRGLQDQLKASQKLVVLRPLAAHMMDRELRAINIEEAKSVIEVPLREVGTSESTIDSFLIDLQASSGLLLERETGQWSFAHLTFQEYLTAAHWLEEKTIERNWKELVGNSWWHETLRLYSAQGDATILAKSCLEVGSLPALSLAADCLTEALKLDPNVRLAVQARIFSDLESPDPSRRQLAAGVQLSKRLTSLQRLTEKVEIDSNFLTCAEYQLFLNDVQLENRFHQPDSWTGSTFTPGDATEPIKGMRAEDAIAFCEWLTQREGAIGTVRYRIPTKEEALHHPEQSIATWCYRNESGPHHSDEKAIQQSSTTAQDPMYALVGLSNAAKITIEQQLASLSSLPLAPNLEDIRPIGNIHALRFPTGFDEVLEMFLGRDLNRKLALDTIFSEAIVRFCGDHSRPSDFEKAACQTIVRGLANQFRRSLDLAHARTPHLDYDGERQLAEPIAYETARSKAFHTANKLANKIANDCGPVSAADEIINNLDALKPSGHRQYASFVPNPTIDSYEILLLRALLLRDALVMHSATTLFEQRKARRRYTARLLESVYLGLQKNIVRRGPLSDPVAERPVWNGCWWLLILCAREERILPAWEGIRIVREQLDY